MTFTSRIDLSEHIRKQGSGLLQARLSDALDLEAQANPEADAGDLAARYPKAQIRDFDGDPERVTEMDALVAYLQMLGTLVDVDSAAAQEALTGQGKAGEKGR